MSDETRADAYRDLILEAASGDVLGWTSPDALAFLDACAPARAAPAPGPRPAPILTSAARRLRLAGDWLGASGYVGAFSGSELPNRRRCARS